MNPYLTLHSKINSKWIRDLKVRSENVVLLEGNIGKRRLDVGMSNIVLDTIPKAQAMKAKREKKIDRIKLKNFSRAKEIINRGKRLSTK